jgi:hypothetical protein
VRLQRSKLPKIGSDTKKGAEAGSDSGIQRVLR